MKRTKYRQETILRGNILLHPGYKHLDDASKYPEANQVLNKVFFLGCSPTINDAMLNYIEDVVGKFQ